MGHKWQQVILSEAELALSVGAHRTLGLDQTLLQKWVYQLGWMAFVDAVSLDLLHLVVVVEEVRFVKPLQQGFLPALLIDGSLVLEHSCQLPHFELGHRHDLWSVGRQRALGEPALNVAPNTFLVGI